MVFKLTLTKAAEKTMYQLLHIHVALGILCSHKFNSNYNLL